MADGPQVPVPDQARPVKLVVWDLDDTLWEGTLSEGTVTLPQSRIDLVRTLNRRGIVNSVCSKNDPSRARTELERVGLWDELVFAQIDWTPKGGRVARIVADAQLRPEEVLFVDDLPLNREEVRHAVPGIQVAGPEIIEGLLDRPQLAGKDDGQLTRLGAVPGAGAQARRPGGRIRRPTRPSSGPVTSGSGCSPTPSRRRTACSSWSIAPTSSTSPSDDPTGRRSTPCSPTPAAARATSGYATATATMGSAASTPWPRMGGRCPTSCSRAGSSTWVWSSGSTPSSGLPRWTWSVRWPSSPGEPPHGPVDWITRDDAVFDAEFRASGGRSAVGTGVAGRSQRVLMVGGCDLTTAEQFLGGDIATEFSHTGPTGAFIFVGHTETLRQSAAGIDDRPADAGRPDPLPRPAGIRFAGRGRPRLRRAGVQRVDRLHPGPVPPPSAGSGRPVAPVHRGCHAARPAGPRSSTGSDGRGWAGRFLEWFAGEFEFLGGITVDRFQENIRWLARSMPPGAQADPAQRGRGARRAAEGARSLSPPPGDECRPGRGGGRAPQRVGL